MGPNPPPLPDDPSRRQLIAPTALLALLCGGFVAVVLIEPSHFAFDDSYRYLVIADNIAAGEGTTFNGQVATNGYHPLWLALCVPIAMMARAVGIPVLPLTIFFQAGLGLVAILFAARAARQASLPHPLVAGSLLLLFLFGGGLWLSAGWLGALFLLAGLSLLIGAFQRPDRTWSWPLVGAVLGLAVLARLDLIFLAAAACLSPLWAIKAPLRNRLRIVGLAGTAVGIVLAPYLLFNLRGTGHLVPVSGALKAAAPTEIGAGIPSNWGTLGLLSVLAGGVAVVLAYFGAVRGTLRDALTTLGGATLAHGTFVGLLLAPGWATDHDYYYLTGVLTLACAASLLFDRLKGLLPSFDARARARLGAWLGVLLLFSGLLRSVLRVVAVDGSGLRARPVPAAVALGRWMGANLPATARTFTLDSPGRLAWYSGRAVLAADGLTQVRSYGEELTMLGLEDWLTTQGVTHVVSTFAAYESPWSTVERSGVDPIRWTVLNPWTEEPVGTLELDPDGARSVASTTGDPGRAVVGLWTWPPDQTNELEQ